MAASYLSNPPPGCYRRRLCLNCKVQRQVEGYLLNDEKHTLGRGTCEACGKRDVLSAVYRYTLSARARRERGLP